MSDALSQFPPTAMEARRRLEGFVPKSGTAYAQTRNFDQGPGHHKNVSVLSPYLRTKLLDERDVTRAVLDHHSAKDADKFLTEVFWRTYWKGWMELRPAVWESYRNELDQLSNDIQTQSGLRQRWEAACLGKTGIDPFDAWAQELAHTGYLHNHARMWFASIWIFTLDLPWQLGADFFLRHLLDGDAAVNTLSWRWVAGIQTRGKTYLATPDNIAKFTGGRFRDTDGLAQHATPVEATDPPAAGTLPSCVHLPLPDRYGVLIHSDDVDLSRLLEIAPTPAAIAYVDATAGDSPWQMAPHVAAFRQKAAQSAAQDCDLPVLTTPQAITDWAARNALTLIVAPYAPTGSLQSLLSSHAAQPGTVPVNLYRRDLDSTAWPLATKGFFPFRKHIPKLIESFL